MTCRKRCHRGPDHSHLPQQVGIHPGGPGQPRHLSAGQVSSKNPGEQKIHEKRRELDLWNISPSRLKTHPSVANLHDDVWNTYMNASEGSGNSELHPIHPRKLVVSHADNHLFRLIIVSDLPLLIYHDGDMSLTIYILPVMWAHHQTL